MLEGPRTVLRPLRSADAERQHLFDQDMELCVLDSRSPVPARREQADDFVAQRFESQLDVARLAIEADQRYIGHCSLSGLRDAHGNLELGIVIGDREYWSRGYGREVVRVLLGYAFQARYARRIALTTHEDNPRAIRCYAACGFVEEGRPRQAFWTGHRYADLVEMSILREEWAAANSVADTVTR
ncbi:GNAT family N-acetyltransferase [Micromonospora sp. DT81.3]|uniref:GNAT family N-acetyltransferase n=1 Tax=Micromonospora sp. DT81.3 TaxID=3416523 RepID=UPI003CF36E1A